MAFLGQDMAAFLSLSNLSVEIRRDNVREPANEAFWFRFFRFLQLKHESQTHCWPV